jgi:hypothetical protein
MVATTRAAVIDTSHRQDRGRPEFGVPVSRSAGRGQADLRARCTAPFDFREIAYTAPTISPNGGQKYPAVVLAGHRVTVELSPTVRRSTSLLYADDHGRLPDGRRTVGDGHGVVDFRACATGRGDSAYDGHTATFWSGFVLTTAPRCLKLRVWVDDERTPRRAQIPLGKRCQ